MSKKKAIKAEVNTADDYKQIVDKNRVKIGKILDSIHKEKVFSVALTKEQKGTQVWLLQARIINFFNAGLFNPLPIGKHIVLSEGEPK